MEINNFLYLSRTRITSNTEKKLNRLDDLDCCGVILFRVWLVKILTKLTLIFMKCAYEHLAKIQSVCVEELCQQDILALEIGI